MVKAWCHDSRERSSDAFDVPDRITGKQGLDQLNPERCWNFIEVTRPVERSCVTSNVLPAMRDAIYVVVLHVFLVSVTTSHFQITDKKMFTGDFQLTNLVGYD